MVLHDEIKKHTTGSFNFLSPLFYFFELRACSVSLFSTSGILYMKSAEDASGIDIEHNALFDIRSETDDLHFACTTTCCKPLVAINEYYMVTDRWL
jgi:hypothetical protein